MQLACPACAATYQVPDAMIGEGRQMKCVRCGESWFASAPLAGGVEDEPTSPVAPPPQPIAVEPAAIPTPSQSPAAEATPPRRSGALLSLAWVGSLAAWAAGLYVLWSAGETLMALWPPIARLYAWVGPA